ncbi:hypothetical protein [Haloarcula onubensis]|uniref:Uncharacterized protein n=1 Tax=Haloarcula onubensis TaxID=2950539 RepID=A0ABU2FQ72_9EURY|nr:hypothetical protein [Halomicroarcula sp. S3CR25-11]MDS0282898.1 hypothetical protein [Halomicroarcula sp. S3CR25-11]
MATLDQGIASDDGRTPAQYDRSTHWISRQLEAGLPFGVGGEFLTGVVKFALVWDLLAAAYVLTQWRAASTSFLVAGALFLAWVNVAPALIWYYDKSVLPRFFAIAYQLVVDADELERIAETYNRRFATVRPLFALFWGLGFLVAGVFAIPLFETQGMVGDGRVFLWTTLAFGAYVGAVLGEAGFSAVVTTVLCIREISTVEIDIKPLHPDGLGGLGAIGYFAIRTTVLWSTASLLSPLAFQMASASLFDEAILLVTATYIGTILFSFVYPTLKINRQAKESQERILAELRDAYVELERELETADDDRERLGHRLDLQRLRNRYDDYATVQLYPMQTAILTRLIGSVLLPLGFLVLELYLPNSL